MPWCFKLDKSLSPKGNIEGQYGGLCLCPDILLTAVGCSSWGMVWYLAMHILGEFEMGLAVCGTRVCMRLL